MNIFVLAFVGGLVGAVLMDITETQAEKIGISSGVNLALVGRWFIGLTRGQLRHSDIQRAPPQPGEVDAGWAFHVFVGGGGIALIYPAVLQCSGLSPSGGHVFGGLLFGLATCLLPWLILLPAFGWGLFGRRGPPGANAVLAAMLSHVPYGVAVGAAIAMGTQLH